jgi:hypothetical protein
MGKIGGTQDRPERATQPYWAAQVDVQIFAAQAWLLQGQGNRAEAD